MERATNDRPERAHREYRDGSREAAMARRGIVDDRQADELRARAVRRAQTRSTAARTSPASLALARARLAQARNN